MRSVESVQFFLREKRSERLVLEVLSEILGFGVDSLNFLSNRPAFAQIDDYSQGFKQGFLISWPAALEPRLSTEATALELATRLDLTVLTELEGNEDIWLISTPGGISAKVPVVFLDDGMDLVVRSPMSPGESGR